MTTAISLRRLQGIVNGELYCNTETPSPSKTFTLAPTNTDSRAVVCLNTSSSVTRPGKALTATRRSGTRSIFTASSDRGAGGALDMAEGMTNFIVPGLSLSFPLSSCVPPVTKTGIVIAMAFFSSFPPNRYDARVLNPVPPIDGVVATVNASYLRISIFSGIPRFNSPSIVRTTEYFGDSRPLGVERRAFLNSSLISSGFGNELKSTDAGGEDFIFDSFSLLVFTNSGSSLRASGS
mmetsp:Transcript_11164/g.13226  ORF Transcript_11164/g.13226 Transcript_11164/m.13226 type:complete len:236 (-) Transcript_11164:510-1217(-)